MKSLISTLRDKRLIPDDAEICEVADEDDMIECVRIGDEYFYPDVTWMKFTPPKTPKRYHNEAWTPTNGPLWVQAEGSPIETDEVEMDYILGLEPCDSSESSSNQVDS